MGDLSPNVSRSEVACKCGCGFDTIDIETLFVLQECCDYFAKALGRDFVVLIIHSGCRCPEHNSRSNGGSKSQHLYGRAVDFSIRDVTPNDIFEYLNFKYPDQYGLGYYPGWVHLDTKSGPKRRW